MKRSYVLMATTLLTLGLLFDWRLTKAHEHDQPASALLPVHQQASPEVTELKERIEQLEKRLAALEGDRPLIRQADSRESAPIYQPQPNLAPRTQPDVAPERNDDEGSQTTNGRKWRFRLLSSQNR